MNRTKKIQLVGIFLPIVTLIIALIIWWRRKKASQGRGTIAPEFAIPTEDPPILVGALDKERIGPEGLTASLINLARKGYLKIIQEKNKGFLGTRTDFKFEKLKSFDDLDPIEKELAVHIFGSKDSVKSSDLKDNFYTDYNEIKKEVFEEAIRRDWFKKNPETARVWYWSCGLGCLFSLVFAGIVIAGMYKGGGWIAFGGALSGIIAIIFSSIIAKKTKEGRLAQEKWLGFKMFLSKTERFKMAELEEKDSKLKELGTGIFEQYLPYALVLGVAQNWSSRFKDLDLKQPDWYQGDMGTAYTAMAMNNSLTTLNSTASSTMLSSPGGGGGFGSGSGFGGGGSAGGGLVHSSSTKLELSRDSS